MKKELQFFVLGAIIMASFIGKSYAGIYNQYSSLEPTTGYGDTMFFSMPNAGIPAGSATVTFLYRGNLAAAAQFYNLYDANNNLLATSTGASNCGPFDSLQFTLSPAQLNATIIYGNLKFYAAPSSSVGSFCANSDSKLHVVYSTVSYPNDVGVLSIDSPAVYCQGIRNVLATIKNYGDNVITAATVNWSVNGALQTPYNFSGSLDTVGGLGSTTAQVTLGSYNFILGPVYNIKVWTSNPNAVADTVNGNDTANYATVPAVNGMFTLGGVGADFPSFDSAVSYLTLHGICGPVVINVYDTTYNEQVVFDSIAGSSPINTITFVGDSLNHPLLTTTSSNVTDNYTVKFESGSFYRLKSLNITNQTANYGRVIDFGANSTNNIISNCYFANDTTPSSSSNLMSILYSANSTAFQDTNNVFTNNIFKGGSYGMYWGGSNTYDNKNTTITNNTFINQYNVSLYLYDQHSFIVKHNLIHSNSSYGSGYGLFLRFCTGNIEISYNNIYSDLGNSWLEYGIFMYYVGNSGQYDTTRVFNNFISVGDSLDFSTNYGIFQNASNYNEIYNNNINLRSNNVSSIALRNFSSHFSKIYNNILNVNSGIAFYTQTSFPVAADNNDLYTGGNVLVTDNGTNYATLSSYQAAMNQLNSISINPLYNSDIDLHTCNDSLKGAGINYNNLMTDIDNQGRDTTNPVIGADAFFNPADSAFLGPDITLCPGDTVILGFSNQSGTYLWSTGDTTSSITVDTSGTYYLTAQNACGSGTDNVTVTLDSLNAAWIITQQTGTTVVFDGPFGYSSYFWIFGDGGTSSIENPSHTYPDTGNYTVTLIVNNQCGADTVTNQVSVSTTGINELNTASIKISPNPSNGKIVLSLRKLIGKKAAIKVINIAGKLVYQSDFTISSDAENKVINLNEAAGIYTMKIMVGHKMSIKKLVIK